MSRHKPRISVILPVWNAETTLEDALDSIVNQAERDIEVVAVDDQSTDNSAAVLRDYAENDDRVKVMSSGGLGSAGGARNVGLEAASGEFVSFVDSDDWIDTNFLVRLVSALEHTNAEIAIAGVKREYHSPSETQLRYTYEYSNTVTGDFALELLSRYRDQDIAIGAAVTNKLFRKSFLEMWGFRFLEGSINEDDVFTFIAFIRSNKVSIVPDTYYHIRQRMNSTSRSFSKRHIVDLYDAFHEIRHFLEDNRLFDQYKNSFYSYFEKCLSFVIETMQKNSLSKSAAEECAFLILSKMHMIGDTRDIISYLGHKRMLAFVRSF